MKRKLRLLFAFVLLGLLALASLSARAYGTHSQDATGTPPVTQPIVGPDRPGSTDGIAVLGIVIFAVILLAIIFRLRELRSE